MEALSSVDLADTIQGSGSVYLLPWTDPFRLHTVGGRNASTMGRSFPSWDSTYSQHQYHARGNRVMEFMDEEAILGARPEARLFHLRLFGGKSPSS